MGQKDLSEKILLNYNDVFADIVNGLIFKGEQRIKPSELTDKIVHAQYKAEDDRLHEEERDIFKNWSKQNLEIVLCGLENQTDVFRMMPARNIGYDGAAYRSQLLESGRNLLTPVVTLVLYFGMTHWNQPKTLKGLMGNIPPEIEPYINDYRIHVFEVAWFSEEEISRFTGDFQVVARFFSEKRKNRDYIPDDPKILEHVNEVLKLLSVMTGDHRYEEILFNSEERNGVNMCDVAERLETKGKNIGREEGRIEMLYELVQDGDMSIEKAASKAGISVDDFTKNMILSGYEIYH